MRLTPLSLAFAVACALPDAADVCYETTESTQRAADGTPCPATESAIGYSMLGPNVMLAVDRSTSMDGHKWGAVQGLTPYLPMVGERANLGLSVFPGRGRDACSLNDSALVPMSSGASAAEDVSDALLTTDTDGSTPMAAILKSLIGDPALQCPNRDNIVVLLTDGEESCGGDPEHQAEALTNHHIPVELYVIGFGTTWQHNQSLQAIAHAGSAHTGPDNFYTASTVDDLLARLAAVTGTCRVQLDTGVDAENLIVSLDGHDLSLCTDARCSEGFTYDAEHSVVQLEGQDCLALQDGTCHDLSFASN